MIFWVSKLRLQLLSRPQEHFDVWWKGIGNLIAQAELLQIGKSMKILIIFMENSIKMWMITLRGTPMTKRKAPNMFNQWIGFLGKILAGNHRFSY